MVHLKLQNLESVRNELCRFEDALRSSGSELVGYLQDKSSGAIELKIKCSHRFYEQMTVNLARDWFKEVLLGFSIS